MTDPLVQAAVIAEVALLEEIVMLQRYKRKLDTLLVEKHLNDEQKMALCRILNFINDRNLKLYGG